MDGPRIHRVIISHRHRFIFVKTRKVAGSSIELYLRQFCGPEDVITPLMEEAELAGRTDLAGPSPTGKRLARPWHMTPRRWKKLIRERKWPVIRTIWSHQPARRIREYVGEDVWNSYFRFSVTRNPWDRAVSSHYWLKSMKMRRYPSIDETIENLDKDWENMSIDDRLAVDYVIRYENLLEDFQVVCDRIGIPRPTELPRLKSDTRPANTAPTLVLTEEQIRRIGQVCRREIETFGYERP